MSSPHCAASRLVPTVSQPALRATRRPARLRCPHPARHRRHRRRRRQHRRRRTRRRRRRRCRPHRRSRLRAHRPNLRRRRRSRLPPRRRRGRRLGGVLRRCRACGGREFFLALFVAGADTFGPRDPFGRQDRVVGGQQAQFIDRHHLGPGVPGEHGVPLPAAVAGQLGFEQVRDQAVALALGREVPADLFSGGDALDGGTGDVDGGGQEGIGLAGAPDGNAVARLAAVLVPAFLPPAAFLSPAGDAV